MHDFLNDMEAKKRADSYSNPWWLLPALCLVIAFGLLIAVWPAHSNPPEGVPLPFEAWFKAQKQMDDPNLTSCCGGPEEGGGDGHYVFVKHEMGKWYVYVRELERWEEYPRIVDPDLPNPTGKNVAWYSVNEDGSINWYCLRISIGI